MSEIKYIKAAQTDIERVMQLKLDDLYMRHLDLRKIVLEWYWN